MIILDSVTDFTLVITQFKPLSGSSYVTLSHTVHNRQKEGSNGPNVKNDDNRQTTTFYRIYIVCAYVYFVVFVV